MALLSTLPRIRTRSNVAPIQRIQRINKQTAGQSPKSSLSPPTVLTNLRTGSHGGYVVENLQPSTNYEFRFAAANEAGRGNWAMNKVFSTTMRNVPGPVRFLPGAPENDYLRSNFHDKYNLKWSAAPDNGERIDYYEIKWCEAKRYSGYEQWEVQEGSCAPTKVETKQETWIQDLKPDTYYKIEVRAHNSLGLGTAANVTIKTTRSEYL